VLAFESAQPKPVHIAHHRHLAGQVRYCVKKKIPTMVLIRDPIDACVSLIMREPFLTPRASLRMYLAFYEPLLSVMDHVVIAGFEDVISDFSNVIRKVNEKFDCSYGLYENDRESDAEIFQKIKNLPYEETRLSICIPTEEKEPEKVRLKLEFKAPHLRLLVDRCRKVYAHLITQSEGKTCRV
jgi:hypothetical protein